MNIDNLAILKKSLFSGTLINFFVELLGDNQNDGDYLFSLLVDEHRLVQEVLI